MDTTIKKKDVIPNATIKKTVPTPDAIVKKELILEGLNCAHCTIKIEDRVGKLENVVNAALNFSTKVLTVEIHHLGDANQILTQATQIIKKLEPDVVVKKVEPRVLKLANAVTATATNSEILENQDRLNKKRFQIARFTIGTSLFIIGLLFQFTPMVELGVFLTSYLLVGGDVIIKALKNLLQGQLFDENFLMGIATVGAFAIGEYPEGVAVMVFYQIGEFFQDAAVDHSRKSITALMDIRPDYANLKVGEDYQQVIPESVLVGDVILIKAGEKVPLDGRVLSGYGTLDTSAITGEALPRDVEAGDEVLSGTINQNGLLTVEVTKTFGESTVSKILDLVQNASNRKSPTENFITKFARYYTPVVVLIALAMAVVPPLLITGATFSQWIYRALVFLVVSCPCALVISIPLGFFGGIGGASKAGILMKGSNYLEALNQVDTVVFDKTGTLTKGVFTVTKVEVVKGGITKDALLEIAAYTEVFSNHPIAKSIVKAYGKAIDQKAIVAFKEISGHGIQATVGGKAVLAGNLKLMQSEGIAISLNHGIDGNEDNQVNDLANETGTLVHLAVDRQYAGYIVIEDVLKDDAHQAIQALRKQGVKQIIMLTGDRKSVGDKIGQALGLDAVYSELLPDQKVEKLEMIEAMVQNKGKVVFVGDGINDAPVLTRADIGIAMGGLGSDAAIEAADVVLMTDEPSKVATAIQIAKRTKQIVWQNILFAFGVKAIVLILGAGGLATMWEAVFADVGVAILAVLNAMRVLHTKQ